MWFCMCFSNHHDFCFFLGYHNRGVNKKTKRSLQEKNNISDSVTSKAIGLANRLLKRKNQTMLVKP